MRPIEEIHAALQRIHAKACDHAAPAYMSVPANPERDADLIVSDAIAELAKLRKRVEDLEKALKEIAKGAATSMEPPTSAEAACGNLDDAYSDGFARAIWCVGSEARKALGGKR